MPVSLNILIEFWRECSGERLQGEPVGGKRSFVIGKPLLRGWKEKKNLKFQKLNPLQDQADAGTGKSGVFAHKSQL